MSDIRRILKLALSLLLGSTPLLADTIQGHVSSNGGPLDSAHVQVISGQDTTNLYTDQTGFYIGTFTEVTEILDIPVRFSISPNYPNPFNPSTNIDVGIHIADTYKLEVFDITGRRIVVIRAYKNPKVEKS